jgi:hypothetical protein
MIMQQYLDNASWKKEIMNNNKGLLQHSYHTKVGEELLKHTIQRAFRKCVTAAICRCSQI